MSASSHPSEAQDLNGADDAGAASVDGADDAAHIGADDVAAGDLAAEVVAVLTAAGETVAVAESVTGGLVCAAITDVPGASAALRGGIIAYATDLKAELLGVSSVLLGSAGPVHPVVGATMASAVRARLGATYGLATTGVAGPEPQNGHPVGTVYVAVDGPEGSSVERHQLSGERADVRDEAVAVALRLLLSEASPHDER